MATESTAPATESPSCQICKKLKGHETWCPWSLPPQTKLLEKFAECAEITGLVGEALNAQVIVLAAVSALRDEPLSVSIHGSSSTGKNRLMGNVANFIPDDMKKEISGMTPKALNYSGKDEFKHKAVFIYEYEGVKGADHAMRIMQSERRIEHHTVDMKKKGPNKKQTNVVEGPFAVIQATTQATLHPENETRLLFLKMDESEKQTQAIMDRQASDAAGEIDVSPNVSKWWHALIHNLQSLKVVVPFAHKLSIPATNVRARRDFPKLLELIKVCAFLHQFYRPRDDKGRIVASQEDYREAKRLFEHCYANGPDESVRELLGAAKDLNEFSVDDVMAKTKWKKTKAYAVFNRAMDLGHVAPSEFGHGKYNLAQAMTESALRLPDVEEVFRNSVT